MLLIRKAKPSDAQSISALLHQLQHPSSAKHIQRKLEKTAAAHMIDVLVALRFAQPLPRGRAVALVGAGGGPAVLASDEVEKARLELPHLSPEVQSELRSHLPLAGSIFSNPVDTPNLATPRAIAAALRILSRAPDIHMIVYHLGFHPISQWGLGRFSSPAFLEPVITSFVEATEATGKPVLLALRPPLQLNGMEEFAAARAAFVNAGLPVFHSLRAGARAMSRAVAWRQASTEA